MSPAKDESVLADFIKLLRDVAEAWRRLAYVEVDIRVSLAVVRLC